MEKNIFNAVTAIQERLDKTDPFRLEYFLTLDDDKLSNILIKREEELTKPLVKGTNSMIESIKTDIKIVEDIIALRSYKRLRKKLDEDDELGGITLT